MKKIILVSALIVLVFASHGLAQRGSGMMRGGSQQYPYQMGPGMMEGGYGYGMGSGMMGYGMGPGMMHGMMGGGYETGPCFMGGYGMGSGMMGRGYGMGQGMRYYNPEQYDKFLDDTKELRKKIHDKQFEYFEAARDPKATRESLMKKEKELFELKQQMQEKGWDTMKE